jgi:hypothetical protein
MKSGNLNFLEPSGPLQAGNGADCFTFTFYCNTIGPPSYMRHVDDRNVVMRRKTVFTFVKTSEEQVFALDWFEVVNL